MPCDTKLKPRQTVAERKAEVKAATEKLNRKLALGLVKPIVNKQTGAIAFEGFTAEERDGVTDACAYRRLMVTGSSLAKAAIERAEMLAGRTVNKQALAQGVHSHDGGKTWHNGH